MAHKGYTTKAIFEPPKLNTLQDILRMFNDGGEDIEWGLRAGTRNPYWWVLEFGSTRRYEGPGSFPQFSPGTHDEEIANALTQPSADFPHRDAGRPQHSGGMLYGSTGRYPIWAGKFRTPPKPGGAKRLYFRWNGRYVFLKKLPKGHPGNWPRGYLRAELAVFHQMVLSEIEYLIRGGGKQVVTRKILCDVINYRMERVLAQLRARTPVGEGEPGRPHLRDTWTLIPAK